MTSLLVLFLSLIWLHPRLEGTGIRYRLERLPLAVLLECDPSVSGWICDLGSLRKFQLDEQMARVILRRVGTSLSLQYLSSSGEAPSFIHWMGIGLPLVLAGPIRREYGSC